MNLKEHRLLNDDSLVIDYANLDKRDTGIRARIFISSKIPQHKPRIRVYRRGGSFTLSVKDCPKLIAGNPTIVSGKIHKQVIEWVKLNKGILLKYWNNPDMLYRESSKLIENLKKV